MDDPQEGGAWILHSAGTVPRQGHSALAESAATAASGLKCGVTVCLSSAGLGSTAGNLEWGLFLIPWGCAQMLEFFEIIVSVDMEGVQWTQVGF